MKFFAKGNVNTRAKADEFKAAGKSAEEFRAFVMSDAFKPEPLDLTVPETPAPGSNRSGDAGQSLGQIVMGKKEVQAFARNFSMGDKVRVKLERGFIGRNGKSRTYGEQNRAGFNTADLASVNVTISQSLIALGVQRLTIMDLLAGGTMGHRGVSVSD